MPAKWTRIEVGLVLQGGGALGAYEWGAIEALFALMDQLETTTPVTLKVVTGVSIGAINGACIVGVKGASETERRKKGLEQAKRDMGWAAEISSPEAADLWVVREGGLDMRRGFLAALVVSEHERGAELEVSIVCPVGTHDHDPLVREAVTDLVPRQALSVLEIVRCHGFHRVHQLRSPRASVKFSASAVRPCESRARRCGGRWKYSPSRG